MYSLHEVLSTDASNHCESINKSLLILLTGKEIEKSIKDQEWHVQRLQIPGKLKALVTRPYGIL